MTTDLPPGWEWARVDELCEVTLGQSPPGSSYNDVGQGSPFLQGKAEFGATYPSIRKWTTQPKKYACVGSVLVSVRAPVGPTNLAPVDCSIGRGLAALRPREPIATKFMLWAMRASENRLVEQASGSTFDAITGAQLREHRLPVPPLPDQDRIVAVIEEHFSHLDTVESTLERGLKSVAAMRMSLLTDAFKVDGTLPHDWRRTEIGQVAKVQLGRQRSPQHHAGPQMRPYLRAANVSWAGLSLDDVKQMNFDEGDFETYRLWPGDLLLNEASGSPNEVGKPAVWNGEIADCCFQNTLLRLQARDINPGYLYWYCYMAATTGRFGEAGRGVNIRHLGKQGLARFPIHVAPGIEQEHIVTRLQEQFRQASGCEAAIQLALTRTHALRRSILTMAFAGRLVPRDRGIEPFAFGGWLARKNPNDEPASVMLEGSEAGTR